MKRQQLALTPALLALAVAAPAVAEVKAGDLTVQDAAMRAVAPGVANTAGYLTILNGGSKPDQLLSASCTCAKSVEVHLSHVMNGMAMMMPAGPVEIPAGGKISFAPGGYHLMVMGLKAPLKDGGSQELTLKFEHAGALTVPFAVKAKIGG
jgi:copper(I)-binding protein